MIITTKTIPKKMKCNKCKKTDGTIKFYIDESGDGVPKTYHPKCRSLLKAKSKKK